MVQLVMAWMQDVGYGMCDVKRLPLTPTPSRGEREDVGKLNPEHRTLPERTVSTSDFRLAHNHAPTHILSHPPQAERGKR